MSDVTNTTDALNGEESARNSETSKRSGARLKLLCNPQRLPEPKIPRTGVSNPTDEARRVVNFFSGTGTQEMLITQERQDGLKDDSDWYSYHGDSTIYRVGRSGFSVHLPCDGKPDKADCGEDGSKEKDSG